MELEIECCCDCKFVINHKVIKRKGDIVCPNCGRPLPCDTSVHVKKMFEEYSLFTEELNKAELYNSRVIG